MQRERTEASGHVTAKAGDATPTQRGGVSDRKPSLFIFYIFIMLNPASSLRLLCTLKDPSQLDKHGVVVLNIDSKVSKYQYPIPMFCIYFIYCNTSIETLTFFFLVFSFFVFVLWFLFRC